LVEEEVEYISATDTKKAIVNIDVLAKEFNDGDVVDLTSLKAKKLIDKKSKTVKILARGAIDKKLTVRAGEFSNTALKMIILTGGTAVHVTYKVK
jgi:large subunit ribosomal protein L15